MEFCPKCPRTNDASKRYNFFLNTIFVSSHMYPENPEGTQVIVGSMNMDVSNPSFAASSSNLPCTKSSAYNDSQGNPLSSGQRSHDCYKEQRTEHEPLDELSTGKSLTPLHLLTFLHSCIHRLYTHLHPFVLNPPNTLAGHSVKGFSRLMECHPHSPLSQVLVLHL